MYLNYFPTIHQIRGGLVVSVVYWVFWVGGSNLTALHINFFFQIEETCTLMNISSLKYHLSVIYKQKIVNFYKGRKGLRPMGSNADL